MRAVVVLFENPVASKNLAAVVPKVVGISSDATPLVLDTAMTNVRLLAAHWHNLADINSGDTKIITSMPRGPVVGSSGYAVKTSL